MKLKSKLMAAVIVAHLGLLSIPATTMAQSGASTKASQHLSEASAVVVVGSIAVVALTGSLVVTGVEKIANGASVMVRDASDASGQSATLMMAGSTAASLAVGQVLQASATGVGYVLIAAGRAIAFIPNEVGRSLLHQSSYSR